jgi:hypothetical protein
VRQRLLSAHDEKGLQLRTWRRMLVREGLLLRLQRLTAAHPVLT